MTIQEILPFVLRASIVMTIFAVALDAEPGEGRSLFRRPEKLVRSLVAMNVVMPVFAVIVVALFPMAPVVKVVLVALSVSPVPPFLPGKAQKTGGSESYVIGLLVSASLFAIVLIPLTLWIVSLIFQVEMHLDMPKIIVSILTTVLVPLTIGILIRQFFPHVADLIARPLAILASILLAITALTAIAGVWKLIVSLIGSGAILAFLAFVIVGVFVGHMLGGPEEEDRTVLAFATASRHPAIAIAIAASYFPQPKLATAAVVLYLFVSIIATIPYAQWRKRQLVPSHPAR
jgi:bile acid:Na+ symporter, BASS family